MHRTSKNYFLNFKFDTKMSNIQIKLFEINNFVSLPFIKKKSFVDNTTFSLCLIDAAGPISAMP